MAYLGNLFKHKWIFIALSMMVAVFASFHSVKLFIWSFLVVAWLVYLRTSKMVVISCFLLTGAMYVYTDSQHVEQELFPLPAMVKWTDTYKVNGDRLRGFVKDAEGQKYYVAYKLKSEEEKREMETKPLAGRSFLITAAELNDDFRKAHAFSFSMETYLASHGAIGTVEVTEWEAIEGKRNFLDFLYRYRFQINELIVERFPESLAAEAQALMFGEQNLVEEDATRAYQKLGITHLFAISGLHIALVSLLCFQGLIRMGVRREVATVVLFVILPLYGVLAGGAPSVWRAVCVVLIVMLCRYLRWRMPIDDALALCFIGFILINPGVVYQVGFQLSFLATVALIYSTPLLASMKTWWSQSLFMSFICQLLVYPVLLYHFFEVSLSSFLANMIFVPLFSFIILPINFVFLVLVLISPTVASWGFALYEPARTSLQKIIIELQHLPYQMWVPGRPDGAWVFLLYVGIFIGFYMMMKGRWKLVALAIVVPALLLHFRPLWQSDLRISFIDVGQGDSILIEYPRQEKIVLIDSGGLLRFEVDGWQRRKSEYEVGRQVVVPYLKGRGISKIDVFVLSHADADHVEGAEEIVREIRVGEVHISPNSSAEYAMQDLWQELARYQVPIYEKMAKHEIWPGLHYVWPSDTHYEGNNDSLVLRLQYGHFTALFTGDLEEAGEQALVQNERNQIANMTVLKAGHHGSKTSSSEVFIDIVQPKLVIFMAGFENRFGHPHQEVVERFDERKIPYMTTGERGTIEIRTDGNSVKLATMR